MAKIHSFERQGAYVEGSAEFLRNLVGVVLNGDKPSQELLDLVQDIAFELGFAAKEGDENKVWVSVYKDVLGYYDDWDNLTELLVPEGWLRDALAEEGVTDFEAWLDEYMADNTEDIARKAVKNGVILDCSDVEVARHLGIDGRSFDEKLSSAMVASQNVDAKSTVGFDKDRGF